MNYVILFTLTIRYCPIFTSKIYIYIVVNRINLFTKFPINYITMSKFFTTFYYTYNEVFIEENIKSIFISTRISL
ncbi:hypothetical protein CSOJ01_15971 [Colletotrichum sojae]|uniref:Uncharacterized protein n=1 Tax=Colletotrichum sojae TaxID=2175907 RepID=A0A8H6MG99_9PEZI|nr:hypothetical protein CSOJ01_15971 [Colletotrichum sojae]